MITGRDIIYISSIEWDFLWQAHQEIARRLAAAGNRVLYIENTGVRAPGLRDTKRVAARLGRWLRSLRAGGAREVAPNIFVYSPLVMPPFGSTWRRLLNRHVFLRQLRRITRALRLRDVLLWTYLPTDTAVDIIRAFRTERSSVVYYNAADFSSLTPNAGKLQASERELVRMSDVVFATCSQQAARFAADNSNVHVFAPGVDLSAFPDESATSGLPDSLNLSSLPRPIIGYLGGLHRFVDYDLVATMAQTRPSWSWVFLGAHQVPLEKLQGLSNVHLLGQQRHEELAGHLRFFDVCIVPYINTSETTTLVPTKINEYLAAGKAIVSSSLPTVCEFNEQHHILSTTTAVAHDFLQAIESELPTAHDRQLRKQRRKVAALADWQSRLEEMSAFIESK
ncbi:MAG TPA: glycosyltransferase [Pyrinomonadaceae bacterium]|jgi:glycosyltransferase involved in cell wall biosynthesis|nr:glycosyltransferase [Pyrinomonadaceae bacterium]